MRAPLSFRLRRRAASVRSVRATALGWLLGAWFISWVTAGIVVAAEKSGLVGDAPWSFRPVAQSKPPVVREAAWPRDDLDRFVLAKLEAAKLKPNADAEPVYILRRLHFDLVGLPPAPDEVARWERLPRSAAPREIAALADRLLASPRFGERWGRHWLDIVRYADSVGRNWNAPYTYAWRYRDWVIDALNRDTPYDRFVVEQIAGDLLPAGSVDERRRNRVATGMLALGSLDLQALDGEQFALDRVDDQIDVVTRATLALTISCARCHDHKYDPVAMRDYYAIAGVFYSMKTLSGTPYRGRGNGYVDHESLVLLPVSKQGRESMPTVVPGVHSMSDYQAIWSTGKRDIRFTTDPNLAMGVADDAPRDCALRVKGDPHDRGPAPPRGDVRIAGLPAVAKPAATSSGRLELARWIASSKNPLTARVVANRVWQHLVGQPLVTTPDDFGATSEPPSHPELLDHLATRLVAENWSLKKLIRAIALSRTYQLGGGTRDNPARDVDPQNRLCWRANLKRLEFEPLRDSLLAAAGELTFERPEGIQVAGIGGKSQKSQVRGLIDVDAPYRTVYLPIVRGRVSESFSAFDFPDPCQISGRRDVTTVAPQALFFLNGRLVGDSARATARRAMKESNDDAGRNAWLTRQLFGRSPDTEDADDAKRLLDDLRSTTRDETERWTILAQGLMASAEFRYVR